MKHLTIILLAIILFSCTSNTNKIIGTWKADNFGKTAKIFKKDKKIYLMGGGIRYDDDVFEIKEVDNSNFLIRIPPMSLDMKYKDNNLLFGDMVWKKIK